MSTWHFCSHLKHKECIIKMGIDEDKVYNIGPMALDGLHKTQLYNRKDFEKTTKFSFGKVNLLITYHSETKAADKGFRGIKSLLRVLKRTEYKILFTQPAAEEGSAEILNAIEDFIAENRNAMLLPSLGKRLYTSALFLFDVVIGNSSSGIIEAPLTGIGVVNIGDRQKGRTRMGRVVDVSTGEIDISRGIEMAKLISSNRSSIDTGIVKESDLPSWKIMDWLSNNNYENNEI